MNVRSFVPMILAAVALSSCGGGGSTSPSTPAPGGGGNPLPSPSTAATPVPVPSPAALSCPLGNGTLDSQCTRRNPALQEQLEGAIDRVIARQPQLFNLNDIASAGAYRVVNPDGYHAAVVAELGRSGFCANYDGFEIQIKNTNDYSEQYDVLTSDNFIRRGSGAYRSTCTPASFPVDPAEFIAYVRVAFYGFKCQDDSQPRNGAGELPMNCLGYVTATPKKRDGTDVDARIHGPEITWVHKSGHEQVQIETDDATFNGFNRLVVPMREGEFVLCATVRGVEGCLNGKVIPAGS